VGATSGAAVVPNPYRLQAGNADDTASFKNYPMFHTASLERPPGEGNGRFGAGNEPLLAAWLVPAQAVRRSPPELPQQTPRLIRTAFPCWKNGERPDLRNFLPQRK
jgi:hypothetical protein